MKQKAILGLVFTLLTVVASELVAHAESFVVVDVDSPTLYIEPLQNLPNDANPSGWTSNGYDISQDKGKGDKANGDGSGNWQRGIHGVGYGDGDDNTVIDNSDESVHSVYTRSEFGVVDASRIRAMTLEVDYDDGYIAWLNGVEISRSPNMAGIKPEWNSTADSHEAGFWGYTHDLSRFVPLLVNGTNVLALGNWNSSPTSGDTALIPRLVLYDQPLPEPTDPFHCYLTWQGDTSTTMTVNYHTHPDPGQSLVFYDTVSRGGAVEAYAFRASGSSHKIPGLEAFSDRVIHVVELTNLVPGQTYYFTVGDSSTGFTQEKKFRTIPSGNAPIRFITGGDMEANPFTKKLAKHAAKQDPMFALIGGDIAYADGKFTSWINWECWLTLWERDMVTPDGLMIPMVQAIGNHDLVRRTKEAPYFYGYLAQEGRYSNGNSKSYFSRQFGANTIIFVLDSDHAVPSNGEQARWLEDKFIKHQGLRFKFAAYHRPLYPGHRNYLSEGTVAIRKNWLPIFDNHGLTAAFENHDHVFKRTKLLKNNTPDPSGTLYIGDGCFGVEPRSCDQARRLEDPTELEKLGLKETYLAKWASKYHFWLVEVSAVSNEAKPIVTFTAIDEEGQLFDVVRLAVGSGS